MRTVKYGKTYKYMKALLYLRFMRRLVKAKKHILINLYKIGVRMSLSLSINYAEIIFVCNYMIAL
jgi:hypothetical protein